MCIYCSINNVAFYMFGRFSLKDILLERKTSKQFTNIKWRGLISMFKYKILIKLFVLNCVIMVCTC